MTGPTHQATANISLTSLDFHFQQASPFGALLTKTNLQGRVWFPKQAPSVEANKPATLDDETSVVAPTTNKAEGTRRRAVKSYVNRAMRAGARAYRRTSKKPLFLPLLSSVVEPLSS